MGFIDNFNVLVILEHFEEVDLWQNRISFFVGSKLREVFQVVGGSSDKNDIFHVLLAEFIFGHGSSEQKMIKQLRFSVEDMLVGVGSQMAHKTCVISEFFEQQFLAGDQRILNVDDHAHVSVFDINHVIFVVRRGPASAFLGHSVDHSTHRLNLGSST